MFKRVTRLNLEWYLVMVFVVIVGGMTKLELNNRINSLKVDVNEFANSINVNAIETQGLIQRYVSTFNEMSKEEVAKNIYHIEENLLFIQYLDDKDRKVGSIDKSSRKGFNISPPLLDESQFRNNEFYTPTFFSNSSLVQTTIFEGIALSNLVSVPQKLQLLDVSFLDCQKSSCHSESTESSYSTYVNYDLLLKVRGFNSTLLIESIIGLKFHYLSVFFLISTIGAVVRFQRTRMIRYQQNKDFERSHDSSLEVKNKYGLTNDMNNWSKTEQPTLILIQPDNLTSIKSKHGEQAAVFVLEEMRNRLVILTTDDAVYSTGPEQFAVLSSNKDHAPEIHENLKQGIQFREQTIWPTISIGVAERTGNESTHKLISKAEIALWEAMKAKNCIHVYCEEVNQQYQKQIELEQSLAKAIQENSINIHYQVQVNHNGELYGVEALARWDHAKIGKVTPDKFIPIAESAGLMPALGKQIYSKAIRDIQGLSERLKVTIPLSVNVSIREFMIDGFVENLVSICDKYGFDRSRIMLEITETLEVEDKDAFERVVLRLKQLGFRLSLDDFGTGYSSLKLLAELPLNEVKIDRDFVKQIDSDLRFSAIIKSIVNIAEAMELEIVCEGVETNEQFQILLNLGCRNFQGFLFGRPEPIEQLPDTILAATNQVERSIKSHSLTSELSI